MLKTLIAAILLTLTTATPPAPLITYSEQAKTFTVRFEAGASWACVAYESKSETIEQEGKTVPYAFHFCGPVSKEVSVLKVSWEGANCYVWDTTDDCPSGGLWDVYAEVQYENPVDANGATTFSDAKSNILTVKH